MAPLAANTRQQSHSVGEIYHMRLCCLGPGLTERRCRDDDDDDDDDGGGGEDDDDVIPTAGMMGNFGA